MITQEHVLTTVIAANKIGVSLKEAVKISTKGSQLDFLRGAGIDRPISHFTKDIDGKQTSWMVIPENIKSIDLENWKDVVKSYYFAQNTPNVAFDGEYDIDKFKSLNYNNSDYKWFLVHLKQDAINHEYLKRIFNTSQRRDDVYFLKTTGEDISPSNLKKQISLLGKQHLFYLLREYFIRTGRKISINDLNEIIMENMDELLNKDLYNKNIKFLPITETEEEVLEQINPNIDIGRFNSNLTDQTVNATEKVLKRNSR